jgi:hypothetical protein
MKERSMTEETLSHAADANSSQSSGGAAQEDGSARGILRDAIQKVMEEIEHHERQARHHLQQATELRKALKESISFLHEQGEKKATPASPKGGRTDKPTGPKAEEKGKQPAASRKGPKKK